MYSFYNSDRNYNYGVGPAAPAAPAVPEASELVLQSIQNASAPKSKYYRFQIEMFCELTGTSAGLVDTKNEPLNHGQEMLSPFYQGLAPEKESMVTARVFSQPP